MRTSAQKMDLTTKNLAEIVLLTHLSCELFLPAFQHPSGGISFHILPTLQSIQLEEKHPHQDGTHLWDDLFSQTPAEQTKLNIVLLCDSLENEILEYCQVSSTA